MEPESHLIHVHVCVHCGKLLKREQFDGGQIASGIFHCPKCHLDGPLNVEIREIENLKASDESARSIERSVDDSANSNVGRGGYAKSS